jgi:hypothetical protein
MTTPTRPYEGYTDDQLQDLLTQAAKLRPPPAGRWMVKGIQAEIDYRKTNPQPKPLPVAPVAGSADDFKQAFLAQQAVAAMTPDQLALIDVHAAAEVATAAANGALSKATAAATAAKDQFTAASVAVRAAATAAQVVVARLPADQQASLASVASQVPQLVQTVSALADSIDQVASDASTAQGSLSVGQQAVATAVAAAVTTATSVGDGTEAVPAS